ncbi:hypothetical protein HPP92_007452 [Vanilla planifolia]|uniref:C2 NT-type domain-containing protein n=1 Tax=Vanilla planifolia TaxID=51239 RepID=A0A835RKB1_VANPL|nr:hypothetical protein HPP92_007452 [Vanilla planifolia]
MLGSQALDKRPAISGDTESLSQALFDGPKKHRRACSSSSTCKTTTSSSFSSSQKEKKPSFWNWKPFKALSYIRQRRFDCLFSLHVHSIENLPASIANVALSVCWNRTTDPPSVAVGTSPVEAIDGVAEFEETLSHRCSVYGTRKSSKRSAAKYEPRHFLIYVSVVDFPEVNFGSHLVDLTRLLPLNLEDLEEVESSYGRWSTSFRLLGQARGALLNVSFGFSLIGDGSLSSRNDKVLDSLDLKAGGEGSVGMVFSKGRRRVRSHSVDDLKILHEVLPPSLVNTVMKKDFLKCEEIELCYPQTSSETDPDVFCNGEFMNSMLCENQLNDSEFVANKHGIENSERIDDGDLASSKAEENSNVDLGCKANRLSNAHCLVELKHEELPSDVLSCGESAGLEALKSETMIPNQACHAEVRSESKRERLKRESLNPFADVTMENVANEFLDMVGTDHNPFGLHSEVGEISPREQLWKQFEEEIFGSGSVLFGVDIEPEHKDSICRGHNLSTDSQDYDLPPMLQEAEWVIHKATQGLNQQSGNAFPSMQTDKDYTGQSMQQTAREVTLMLETCKRPGLLPNLEREPDHVSPQKIPDSRKLGDTSYLASSINVDGEDKTSDKSSISLSTYHPFPKRITRSCKVNPYLVQVKEEEEEAISQLKVSEMDVAGRRSEGTKEKEWGHSRQQKCGSRWSVATGMGKRYKHPLMKSLAASEHFPVNSTVLLGDSFLSISFHVNGAFSKWGEL